MKRLGPDAFVLVGLLLLFAVLTAALGGRQTGPETRPRYSAFNSGPSGYKAAYLLLARRGVPVGTLQTALTDVPADARVIVTASPFANYSLLSGGGRWDPEEAEAVLKWVRDGGTLIVLEDNGSALLSALDLNAGGGKAVDVRLKFVQPAAFAPRIAEGVYFHGPARWKGVPARAVTLLGDAGPALVAIARGKGVVYAFANPQVWSNRYLDEADNARLLTQMVESHLRKPGRVYFDEYHQGYAEGESFYKAIGRPGRLAMLQLLALAVLLAYSAGRRFGLPRPLPPASRVSSEYIAGVADLYRRAGARDTALEGVYLAFWRDLCRTVGQPLDADVPTVARAAQGLGEAKDAGVRLERLLTEAEEKIARGPELREEEMLALARGLEDMRKELNLGRNDAAGR